MPLSAPLGDGLLALAQATRRELLIVAPYIKAAALQRVLEACPGGADIKVVTRWRLEEIAAGVSDLDVWPLLKGREAKLWLHPSLHAKYYRSDDRLMVGSANLTAAGLGWRQDCNLEVLLDVSALQNDLASFEPALWADADEVNDALHQSFLEALTLFEPFPPPPSPSRPAGRFADWRPQLRFPGDLFKLYTGQVDHLTTAAKEAAAADLEALNPPTLLSEKRFNAWIGLQLLQHPEMKAIDQAADMPRRFGEMRALLRSRQAEDPTRAWQTWARWIDHFLPGRYLNQEANYSEIFQRIRF